MEKKGKLQKWLRLALEINRCPGCGTRAAEDLLCNTCLSDLDLLAPPCCSICGQPFPPEVMDEVLCGRCRRNGEMPVTRSLFRYRGVIRDLILQWKYGPDRLLGKILTEWAVEGYLRWYSDWSPQIIVPVPPTVISLKRRAFSQTLDLAVSISKALSIRCNRNILENRGQPQIGRSRKQRQKEIRGKMVITRQLPEEGMKILIIDDVMTTGETIRETARALKASGHHPEIKALTIARTMEGWGM